MKGDEYAALSEKTSKSGGYTTILTNFRTAGERDKEFTSTRCVLMPYPYRINHNLDTSPKQGIGSFSRKMFGMLSRPNTHLHIRRGL